MRTETCRRKSQRGKQLKEGCSRQREQDGQGQRMRKGQVDERNIEEARVLDAERALGGGGQG